jgi:hypothetical protein
VKQLLLVALLSAVASSALTLLVAGAGRPAPPPAPPGMSAADFKGALADLERDLAALRRELPAGARGEAAPTPAAPAESPPSRSDAPVGSPVVRDPGSAEPAVPSADRLLRFADALPRNAEGEKDHKGRKVQKRRWMFRAESEVLAWFGLPEVVQENGETEIWHYEVPTGAMHENGEPVTRSFWIKINRGRVTDLGD